MGRYIEEDENGNRYIVDDGEGDIAAPAPYHMGADYGQSVGANAWKGLSDIPSAVGSMATDVYDFFNPYADVKDNWGNVTPDGGGPIDSLARAWASDPVDKFKTGGSLAAGTAGAAAAAPFGAGWGATLGAPLGPLGMGAGALIGGGIAGGVGFGAGLLGFDLTTDAATGNVRPTDQYVKDLAYNVSQGAGMGLLTEAAGMPFKGAQGIKQGYNRYFTEDGATTRVGEKLLEMDPQLEAKIAAEDANVAGLVAKDPALNDMLQARSLGEWVGSDQLKNLQRTLARADNETYGRAAEANAVRNDAQLRYLDQIEQSPITPEDIKAGVQQDFTTRLDDAQQSVNRAKSAVDDSLNNLPLPIEADVAGGIIREGYAQGENVVSGKMKAAFNASGDGAVTPARAAQAAAEMMPDYFRKVGKQADPQFVEFISRLTEESQVGAGVDPVTGAPKGGLVDQYGQPITKPAQYTMKDLQAARSDALAFANKGDSRIAAIANRVAEELKAVGDDAVKAGTVTPEEAAAWREGIKLRKKIGTVYENAQTPAKAILSRQPYGEYTIPDSSIPPRVFRPGNKGVVEGIRNYKEAFGSSDAQIEPLERYAVDSFRRYAAPNGQVNAKNANKWIRDHEVALKELPDLRRLVTDVEARQAFLDEKYAGQKMTQAEIEKSAVNYLLKVDAEKVVPEMLNGKNSVARTRATVDYLKANNPDAVKGLGRAVIDYLKKEAFIPLEAGGVEEALATGQQFKGRVLADPITRKLQAARPALERSGLFSKDQLNALEQLYNNKSSQVSVENAKMSGGSDTFQNSSTLRALTKIAAGKFLNGFPLAKAITSVIAPTLRAMPEGLYISKMEEALLNKRIARDAMQKATARNVIRTAETIFRDEINKSFGSNSLSETLSRGAEVGRPSMMESDAERKKFKPSIPKQSEITASKSFPKPEDLRAPAPTGSLKKLVADVMGRQSPESQARVSAESSGDPFATSPVGAQGLAQLMPKTAQDIARDLGEVYKPIRRDMTPEEQQASIEQNVRFGNHYINVMLPKINKAFKDPTLAWAAYNAGPANVTKAIRMAGSTTDYDAIFNNLPKPEETIPYVNRIMAKLG